MKARPLHNYVAIEEQGKEAYALHEGTSILRAPTAKSARFLRGSVLRKGPLVGDEVAVGDTVLYESMSAHRGQTAPMDAAIFGGTEGARAYLIPVSPASLLSAEAADREIAQRTAEIGAIEEAGKRRPLNSLERERLFTHASRIELLTRTKGDRARGVDWNPIQKQGKGAGVVAVVLDSERIRDGDV